MKIVYGVKYRDQWDTESLKLLVLSDKQAVEEAFAYMNAHDEGYGQISRRELEKALGNSIIDDIYLSEDIDEIFYDKELSAYVYCNLSHTGDRIIVANEHENDCDLYELYG